MLALPVILTLVRPASCLLTIKTTLFFYAVIPLFVAFFPAYSFARCNDLSWGNRPADQMGDVDVEERKRIEHRFTRKCRCLSGAVARRAGGMKPGRCLSGASVTYSCTCLISVAASCRTYRTTTGGGALGKGLN